MQDSICLGYKKKEDVRCVERSKSPFKETATYCVQRLKRPAGQKDWNAHIQAETRTYRQGRRVRTVSTAYIHCVPTIELKLPIQHLFRDYDSTGVHTIGNSQITPPQNNFSCSSNRATVASKAYLRPSESEEARISATLTSRPCLHREERINLH